MVKSQVSGIEMTYGGDAEALCPGARRLAVCETAEALRKKTSEWIGSATHFSIDGEVKRIPNELSKKCGECLLWYEVSFMTKDGIPTGEMEIYRRECSQ